MSRADSSKESDDTNPQTQFQEQPRRMVISEPSEENKRLWGRENPVVHHNPFRGTDTSLEVRNFSRELDEPPSQPYVELLRGTIHTQEEFGLEASQKAPAQPRRGEDNEEAKMDDRADLASRLRLNRQPVASVAMSGLEVGSVDAPRVHSQEESKVFGSAIYEGSGRLLDKPGEDNPSYAASISQHSSDRYPSFNPSSESSRATLGRQAPSSHGQFQRGIGDERKQEVQRINQGPRSHQRMQQLISGSELSSSSEPVDIRDIGLNPRNPDFDHRLSRPEDALQEQPQEELDQSQADTMRSAMLASSQLIPQDHSHSSAEYVNVNLSEVYRALMSIRYESLERSVKEDLPPKSRFLCCRGRLEAIKSNELTETKVKLLALGKVRYDESNETHTQVLGICLKLAKLSSLELCGEHWRELGFADVNPCLDFKTTGIVGLLCMAYLMYMAKSLKQALLPPVREDPLFAEICIQCADIALDSLRKGRLNQQINAEGKVLMPALKFFVGLVTYLLEDLQGKTLPRDRLGTSLKKLCKVSPNDIYDAAKKVTKIAISSNIK
jgi:hypothetical protein